MGTDMNPDTQVESNSMFGNEDDEEEKNKLRRPPSSYGSMKSDSEEMTEEEGNVEELSQYCFPPIAITQQETTDHEGTGFQLIRSGSPESLYTMTTEQTKPPGAVVIDTRSSDLGDFSEDDEEDADELLVTDSPEPPEPVEPEDMLQTDNCQPGRLHPEQDLPHVFKSIQSVLTGLTKEELSQFRIYFYKWEPDINLQQIMEGDTLDLVDRMIEILGKDRSLLNTIKVLESVDKKLEAGKLREQCNRALIRIHLQQYLIIKHKVVREGVVRAGKHNLLDTIYVEPEISTSACGGVDPSHEFRPHPPSPIQVPSADTFVGVNNLFRLQRGDGQPVRTLVTTGIPGIGMSISVGKYSLDWANLRANQDLQFIIKLSFRNLWFLRNKYLPPSQKMSIMEVIEKYYPECKDMKYLEEEDCKFLIIMDSYDCYQAPLDWENAPVINDNHTQAHPDVLIVNIVRGTVLRGARVWILGRRAAVSQIPSEFIDVVTEIRGFRDEMKDDYLTRRFCDEELAANIVSHSKCLSTLRILARQPFVCWMIATLFERYYRVQGYGVHPPRLTPLYVNILIVQTNRRLQFYYGRAENDLGWSNEDKFLLTTMGKMAFRMLERNTSVFFKEDVEEYKLRLTEVTALSGLCTELPAAAADGRRTFCFIHFTFQEFMAALYVFSMFRTESTNVLDSGLLHRPKNFTSRDETKSAAGLVQCALGRTLNSPLGHYDMFLRFLCGMLSSDCHVDLLSGYLYGRDEPKVGGLDEVQRLLEKMILTAPEDRVENLKECLREMTQEDQ